MSNRKCKSHMCPFAKDALGIVLRKLGALVSRTPVSRALA